MQDIVEKAMKEQGFNWLMRKMARMQIPRLARWKK
jgi:predicted RNA methylase